jgi:hypothetical protein
MKNKNFDKNELLSHYEPSSFPKKKIMQDVLIHKELILSENGETPEIINKSNKNTNYSNCFVIEEEIEKPKGYAGKKNSQNTKGSHKLHNKNINWRKNEPEQNSGGFFDEFKGKTDEKQVSQFKRNLVNTEIREGSLSIINSVFIDHLLKDANSNLNEQEILNRLKDKEDSEFSKTKNKSMELIHSDIMPHTSHFKTTTISADNFFENADQLLERKLTNTNEQITKENKKDLNSEFPTIKQIPQKEIEDVFNIKNIYKINDCLQYPNDDPLWYIFHPVAKSSFGPITSKNIEEMYNGKLLNEKSEIRFIDVYTLKDHNPFKFFQLSEISREGFINEIDISSLLRAAVNIKSREIQEKPQENKFTITPVKNEVVSSNKTNSNHEEISANSKKESELTILPITKSDIRKSEAKNIDPNSNDIISERKAVREIIRSEELYSPESIYNITSHEQRESNIQEAENEFDVIKFNKRGGKMSNSRPAGDLNVNLGNYIFH